jgi:peptidoglycan/LPS O-acetylase OafA/YrhL
MMQVPGRRGGNSGGALGYGSTAALAVDGSGRGEQPASRGLPLAALFTAIATGREGQLRGETEMAQKRSRRKVGKARRPRWVFIVVIVASAFAMGWAIWMPPVLAESQRASWWTAHAVGGAFGLLSMVAGMRSQLLGRILLGAGGLALLFGVTAFDAFRWEAILFFVLPGGAMLGCVPFFSRMPAPEDQRKTR